MKKLFIVYNSFPVMVYARSKEEANELAKPLIASTRDHHDSPSILFAEKTKQVKEENDIPANKKAVYPITSKDDLYQKKLTCLELFKLKPKICFEHCSSGGFTFSCTIGNRTLAIILDGQKYTLYDRYISPVANPLGVFDDYDDAVFAAEAIFRKDFEELQRAFKD
jgi:hypothetical protein